MSDQKNTTEVNENLKKVYDELVTKPKSNISVLPEAIFVQEFLPYFCGEKNFDDNVNILPTWIGIAGSPMNEVRIIDKNNKPLFNIPAIQGNPIKDVLNKNNGQRFLSVVAGYELRRNVTPQHGENFLNEALEKRIEALNLQNQSSNEDEQRWREILIHYGKAPSPGEELPKQQPLKSDKLADDEIEY